MSNEYVEEIKEAKTFPIHIIWYIMAGRRMPRREHPTARLPQQLKYIHPQ